MNDAICIDTGRKERTSVASINPLLWDPVIAEQLPVKSDLQLQAREVGIRRGNMSYLTTANPWGRLLAVEGLA